MSLKDLTAKQLIDFIDTVACEVNHSIRNWETLDFHDKCLVDRLIDSMNEAMTELEGRKL